jgi:4-hydroxy-tetrahydrodipicolinate synthase
MSASRWQGVVVPMMSPFNADGTVDLPAVKRLVDHLVDNGASGVFPLGTTGEAASIAPAQRSRLVEAAAAATGTRATLYAGVSGNCLTESIESARTFAEMGAQAVVAHPPCYYAVTDAEIEAYFSCLADASPVPLVLYNIPVTTHLSISIESVLRLSRHGNIVAVKDSAGDAHRITMLLERTGGRGGFPVLLGSSALFSHGLKAGGVGIVPSGAHLVGKLYRRMFDAAMALRWDEVDALQKQTDDACAAYLKGRNLPAGLAKLKSILASQGLCQRFMAPPIATLEDEPA